MNDLLRNIPSVTELLESDEIQVVLESTQSEFVVAAARQALDRLRNAILAHDEHEVDVQKLTLDASHPAFARITDEYHQTL